MCVRDIYVADGICQEYCSKKCKICKTKKDDCYECAKFYQMKEEGQCMIESQTLNIFLDTRPLINLLKKRGLKMIFMSVDDLWLYQYHQKEYDGIITDVFETISFI